jgi:cobalt/nickel transport system permease protein
LRAVDRDVHSRSSRPWFQALDARVKLVGIIAFVVTTSLLVRIEALVVSAVLSLTIAATSRVDPNRLARAFASAFPFIAFASLSVFIFAGIDQGIGMVVRASSCVLAILVLANGTEAFDLFAGLRRLGIPAVFTTVLMLVDKYIGLLSAELSRMRTARIARGFDGGRSILDLRGLRVLSMTAGMVFARSSFRAQRTYEGLKSRGFNGDLALAGTAKGPAASDCVFMAGMAGISAVLILLQTLVIP